MCGRHMLLPPLSIATIADPPPCHTPAPFFNLLPSPYPYHFDSGGPVVRLHLGEGFLHPQRAWRNSIWPGSKVLLGAWFCLVASHRR